MLPRLIPGFLLFAIAALSAAEPFTANHLVRIDRVGAPVLSPQGDRVVYAVRHTDMAADQGRYDLWLSTLDGGEPRRLTTHEDNDTNPAWSVNGRQIFFLSTRSGSRQVWRIPAGSGEAQQVTDLPVDVGSFRLSPKGDRLVLSMAVYLDCDDIACTAERDNKKNESKVTARRYEQLFMRHWDHWLDQKRSQLFAMSIGMSGKAVGKPLRLSRIDADVPSRVWGGSEEYAVSPDGRTLYFAARLRNRDEPTSTNFDIYAVPMNGDAEPQNLTPANAAWDTQPVVSRDGGKLAYLAMSRAGFEADKFDVVLLDLASGDSRVLTESWDRSPSALAFAPDGNSLLVNAQDLGRKTLWRLSLDGDDPVRIVADVNVSAFAAGNQRIVYAGDSLAAPTELFMAAVDGSSPQQFTFFGDKTLEDVSLGDYSQFSFAGAGSETVYGYVVQPSDFEKGRKYPVAFLIHGGPQGSFGNDFHYRWNPQTYAGRGFAAVMIDFHGSTGYGQAFTDSISGDWGGQPLEDLKLGLAAALEQFEYLDAERVCALGASYGGYMINWIAGQWPERFRCLVNHDGIFDQRSMYYTTEELWFPEWENGGPYYERADAYEKFNPALFVDRWQTPMLVIHGELDYRVPVTQGIATFTALQRRNIESAFVYFPDENHWVLKPANSVYWHEQVNAWLHRFLDVPVDAAD